jgi:uncharacterized protein
MSIDFIKNCKFFNKLTHLPFVQEIILYGSRSRSDARERSDIDLAIVVLNSTSGQWRQIIEIVEDADTLLSIDCVNYTKLSDDNSLKQAIQKEGVVLYRKKNE